jgi:hypothetical protein
LGADENGEMYGLELNEDGSWRRNSLGYATSCAVIRPVSKETYEYLTEDCESAKEIWQSCVAADKTELGLEEWYKDYVAENDVLDTSFVYDLLDDEDNPTVHKHNLSIKKRMDDDGETDEPDGIISSDDIWDEDGQPMSFRRRVKLALLESPDVRLKDEDDIYEWEASGWFAPNKPFAVEFAPHDLIEQYYRHLETCDGVCDFKRNKEHVDETTNAN